MRLVLDILFWSAQITAFIVAVVQWKNYKETTERNFLFFLSYVLITEFLGYLIPVFFHIKSQFIYNIYILISFSFYLYWFYKLLNRPLLTCFLSLLFIASIIYSLMFDAFFTQLWRPALTAGTLILLVCATLFYADLLKQDKAIDYLRLRKFWIVSGLLIFHIGFLPLQLLQRYNNIFASSTYRISLTILNIILYGFITIGLLCKPKKTT